MKNVNRSLVQASFLVPVLFLGCGGDEPPKNPPPSTPPASNTGGRGGSAGSTGGSGGGTAGTGGGGGGMGGGAGAAMDAPRRAPDAPSTPDAASFTPTPSNLPVLVFDLPGTPIETVGEQKVPGNLTIIESQGKPGMATKVGLALYPTVASPGSIVLEPRDAADKPTTDGLLGLPYQGDWILQACGPADKPCLRNMLGFAIGAQLATGAPKARFVEVYYNEEYKGLFQLIAPATKEQGRVDITEPAADGTGEAISGGYVVRRFGLGASLPTAMPLLDFLSMATEGPPGAPHRLLYSYLFPKPASLTPAQRTYIEGHIAQFEEAMKAPNVNDPNTGYRSWIDVPSFSDFFIFAEVSHNIDGYWKNIVLTKQKDMGAARGKLSITPFWDFSIAFGLPELRSGWRSDKLSFDAANSAINSAATPGGECAAMEWPLPRGMPLCGPNCCLPPTQCRLPEKCWNMPYRPFWWDKIEADPAFRNDTRCRFRDLRKAGGALDMARLDTLITEWKTQLAGGAYERHLQRTPALRDFVFPFNPYRMDPRTAPDPMATPAAFFDKEVTWFRNWVDARLKWLDDNLPGVCGAINEVPRDGGAPPGDGGRPPADTIELARGLIGYWSFDDATGTVAKDGSPLLNNGQLMRFSTADWVPGHLGTGLNYTPTLSPVVLVPDKPELNPTTGLSISAWIKASDWAGNRRIAQKGENDDQYRLTAEGGLLKFHLAGVTNGSLEAVLPATGAFHHVAGTFEGNQIRIYIDGVVAAQEDAAAGAINVTPGNLHIGIKRVGAPQVDSFSGVLDEVAIYNRALNATEVRRLAGRNVRPVPPAPPPMTGM